MTEAELQRFSLPGSRTTRSRLISNTLYSIGGYVLYLPVSLIVNAYAVHRIGLASYGIWAALTTIVGYGSLLDLGVTTPLVKYIAESMALGRRDEVNSLLSTAMVFYCAVASAFAVGMVLASNWVLIHLFHTSASDAALHRLYLAVVLGFVASLTFDVLESLIAGLQRADVNARLSLAYGLLNAAGIFIALYLGLGVNGLVLVWLAVTGVTIAGNYVVAKRLFAPLLLNPLRFSPAHFKKILRFSSQVQVATLTMTLHDQVDRTLIAYVLGPISLGSYQLAWRAAAAARSIGWGFLPGVLPATSDLSAVGESAKLRQLYLRATRYMGMVNFGLCIGVGSLALPLVTAWLGSGHDRVAISMMMLLGAYAIGLPTSVTYDVLSGIGRPGIRMRADLVFLFIHVPLCVVLIWRFGYYGTLVGTAIAFSANRAYMYWAGARTLGLRMVDFVHFGLLQPAIAAVLGLVAVVTLQLVASSRSMGMLVVEIAVFGIVFIGYLAAFGLDQYDRELVRVHFLNPVRSHALRFLPQTEKPPL